MHAYNDLYVEDAQQCLGEMVDYVVYDRGMVADRFFDCFVQSPQAREFERGNPKYVCGMAGADLANRVLAWRDGAADWQGSAETPPSQPLDTSSWFWAGWALAYYQWQTCWTFAQLASFGLSLSKVEQHYLLHESDISAFVAFAEKVVAQGRKGKPTNLHRIRKARKMTQETLARESGTSLRMVQLYEQRRSNIDTAAASTLLRLSRVLGCDMEDLLEAPWDERYEYAVVEV